MGSFKEYIEDYHQREVEQFRIFFEKFLKGECKYQYPLKSRFIKYREPMAHCYSSIWPAIPFYGSTIVPLNAVESKNMFDKIHSTSGFTSRNIDELIDFSKDTGRVQFILQDSPLCYEYMDFSEFESILKELNPPWYPIGKILEFFSSAQSFDGKSSFTQDTIKKRKQYHEEFETLSQFGYNDFLVRRYGFELSDHTHPEFDASYIQWVKQGRKYYYTLLKGHGYIGLVDVIGDLMISNPGIADKLLFSIGTFITFPNFDPLGAIQIFDPELLQISHNIMDLMRKEYDIKYPTIKKPISFPYDIGKFILNKIIYYPENLDACKSIIQQYEDYELYKLLNTLNEAVKMKKIENIHRDVKEISEALDNIWNEADRIKSISEYVNVGIQTSIGIIGELAGNFRGSGILAMFGYQVFKKVMGINLTDISEEIVKQLFPNHLIAIYDFKKRKNLLR